MAKSELQSECVRTKGVAVARLCGSNSLHWWINRCHPKMKSFQTSRQLSIFLVPHTFPMTPTNSQVLERKKEGHSHFPLFFSASLIKWPLTLMIPNSSVLSSNGTLKNITSAAHLPSTVEYFISTSRNAPKVPLTHKENMTFLICQIWFTREKVKTTMLLLITCRTL